MKETYRLDPVDRRLLSRLQQDAGQSHAVLAETVGASPASCWRRIRALQDAGVLERPVWLVDPLQVGCGVTVLCNVRMRSHDPANREAFEQFVQARGEIMECYSVSGDWDYQLRVVAEDVANYERFLMRSLLCHPAVATASSHFALAKVKYKTALPVEQ